jgi:hypothetical protein
MDMSHYRNGGWVVEDKEGRVEQKISGHARCMPVLVAALSCL